MMERGFPAETETKDSWAVTDQERRTNGQEKWFCSQECKKLSYLIHSKLKALKLQWFSSVWKSRPSDVFLNINDTELCQSNDCTSVGCWIQLNLMEVCVVSWADHGGSYSSIPA